MFFLLAHICFKVTLPEKIQSLSSKNSNLEYQECLRLSKDKSIKYIDHMIRCKRIKEEEDDMDGIFFENTTFNSQSYNKDLFYSENLDLLIKNCTFSQCSFQNALIYSNSEGYNFTMTLNTIEGCYNTNQLISSSSSVVISKAEFSIIQDNKITFTDTEHSCRAYLIQKSTNTIFTDNQVINANVGSLHDDKGSGIIFNEGGSGQPLEFSGNLFSNCYGGNGAILVINDAFYHLHIRNTTFENSKNNVLKNVNNEPSGYYILVLAREDTEKPQLSFYDCTFNHLESNAKGGGSIGLWFKKKLNTQMWLTFENTNFTNLYYADNKQPGGALLFYNGASNCNTYLTVTDCIFDNVTAIKDGAAIYYESIFPLVVERCTFKNAVPRNSGSTAAAIYVNFYGQSVDATITECTFENSETLRNSLSVEIMLKSSISNSNNKCTIDGCTFLQCRNNKYVVSSKIYELDFINSEVLSQCGVLIDPVSKFVIQNSQFKNTESNIALSIGQNSQIDDASIISNCVFENCMVSNDVHCFKLDLLVSSFIFSNNVIKGIEIDDGNYYLGTIKCNGRLESLEMRNITFENNQCGSLYGGGSGMLIQGISKLSFIDCKFNNNVARQSYDPTRPVASSDSSIEYLSGDGGAIQIGYSSLTSEIDVLFDTCIFQNNKAFRHGGAIAIQTLKTVEILNCQFIENVADTNDNYPSLLYANHYNKKENGRGGAIYINPCFTYFDKDNLMTDYPPEGILMTNIKIDGCTFDKNKAYDGYAIYVEGDETASTKFVITHNNFKNNYNPDTYTESCAVIVSEISNIYDEKSDTNTFSYDSGVTDIPNKIMYVDHYGKAPSYSFIYGANLHQINGSWTVTDKYYITSSGDAYVQFKFIGIAFNIYGQCSDGFLSVYVDGHHHNEINGNSGKEDGLLYDSPEFEFGEHVVVLQAHPNKVTIAKIGTTTYYQPSFVDANLFEGAESWEKQSNGQGGNRLYTNTKSRYLFSTITCSQFYIFGQKGPNYGTIRIRIGVEDVATVDTQSTEVENFAMLYMSDAMEDVSHQIQIIVESGPVYIDYITYTDSEIYLFENHTTFSYTGEWTESDSGHSTTSTESTLEFLYFGTAFKIFGSKGAKYGKMRVFFDGNEVPGEHSTNDQLESRHALLFDSADNGVNAISGQHSIKISLIEDANANTIEICRISYLQPVIAPTPSASNTPAESPTQDITETQTKEITDSPTAVITDSPTAVITESPTKEITDSPTAVITDSPTKVITDSPTAVITDSPTKVITDSPTAVITESPTKEITDSPTKVITDSPTAVITDSPTKVITESPTKVITDSPTAVITESPTKEITDSPTKVITDSPTAVITDSPTKVITDSPTKVITDSPTKVITESPTKVITETATKVITETATKEPTSEIITESPTEPIIYPDDIFNDQNCNIDNRCQQVVNDSRYLNVYVDKTLFEDYNNNYEYGGAIYLINCGITCNKTKFTRCSATNGGGAIFIRNDLEKQNSILINGIHFTSCSASFGGAIYIYTNTKQVPVRITNCIFKMNTIRPSDNEDETSKGLIGGMSIFLTAKNGKVTGSTFEDDPDCEHGSFKFFNNYDAKPNSHALIHLENDDDYMNKVLVSDCKFSINKKARNSIHFVRGKNGVEFDVQNCIFNGVLSKDSHFIEELIIFKESPKLRIKDCKFSDDSKKSLLLDSSNDYNKINLQNKFSVQSYSDDKIGFNPLKIVINVIIPTLAIVAIIVIALIVLMKKNEIDLLHDSEESNETIDL